MASYYYLISSLPMLKTQGEPPMDYAAFLAMCKSAVSSGVYQTLEELTAASDKGPLLSEWAGFYKALCRELTKLHEETVRTTLAQAAAYYAANEPRGEYVLVVAGRPRQYLPQLTLEEGRFARTLKQGNKEFDKVASRAADGKIDGETAFHLYDTYGFPIEMTVELAKERNLTVDTAARTAKRGGRTLELSAREYALLEYLIRSKGVVLSRQQIEDNLWSLDYAGGTNVVDVYISYLRKKLELPGEQKLLHTVRGMGWVLKEDA